MKTVIQSFPEDAGQKYKINWVQKLEISRELMSMLQEHQVLKTNGFERNISTFNDMSVGLLKIISQFKNILFYKPGSIEHENYSAMLNDFCYIVYRLLEEAKIFKIIFHYEEEKGNNIGTN